MSEIPEQWYGHEVQVEVVVSYKCSECGRRLEKDPAQEVDGAGVFVHVPAWRPFNQGRNDEDVYRRELAKERQAQTKANAQLYRGSIEKCQVGLFTRDRASIYYRCPRKPIYVAEDRDSKPMAVCGTHLRSGRNMRFTGRERAFLGYGAKDEPPANEPVEEVTA